MKGLAERWRGNLSGEVLIRIGNVHETATFNLTHTALIGETRPGVGLVRVSLRPLSSLFSRFLQCFVRGFSDERRVFIRTTDKYHKYFRLLIPPPSEICFYSMCLFDRDFHTRTAHKSVCLRLWKLPYRMARSASRGAESQECNSHDQQLKFFLGTDGDGLQVASSDLPINFWDKRKVWKRRPAFKGADRHLLSGLGKQIPPWSFFWSPASRKLADRKKIILTGWSDNSRLIC